MPDVEYVELEDSLASQSDPTDDPDAADDRRQEKALIMIVGKYHLPASWKPDEHLGSFDPDGIQTTREHITIVETQAADASIAALKRVLKVKTEVYSRVAKIGRKITLLSRNHYISKTQIIPVASLVAIQPV